MPIKAIIYDIEIDILKIHYDPIILKIKKDLHLPVSRIKTLFFSHQFYFFTIGKINFESFIKTSFNELMLEKDYIAKLEKKYKKSLNYDLKKRENILSIGNLFNFDVYFSADIDDTIAASIIKKDSILNKLSFFSSKINSVKQEQLFFEKVHKSIGYEPHEIMVIDDNVDVLLTAKDMSFITLFYDGKRDFYQLLKIISENIE